MLPNKKYRRGRGRRGPGLRPGWAGGLRPPAQAFSKAKSAAPPPAPPVFFLRKQKSKANFALLYVFMQESFLFSASFNYSA
ncbi:MAG: hypothetical protein DBY09_01765 [Selenomonadales bacterium]|nr:MAG: hypothetical protein DBY09_01765 [Selenomonadales bacterium]